jgi:hypothetical protein
MKTNAIRNLSAFSLLATLLVGCSSATGPDAPPPDPAITDWDVNLALQFIWVHGDCENDPSNPGEFAYEIRLETTAPLATVESDSYKTGGFPSNSGARTYLEDQSYDLNGNLLIRGVPDDRRDEVFLRFWAIEYDGSDRDSRLSPEQEVIPVPFRTATARERATTITVGRQTGACRLSLTALPTWSPAR